MTCFIELVLKLNENYLPTKLFLIYINDIVNCSQDCYIRLFADDTNSFVHDCNINSLYIKGNKIMTDLSNWLLANRLTLNVDKTNFSIFSYTRGTTRDYDNLKLYFNNNELSRASCVKYLGVLIDDELKWSEHIKSVYNKLIRFAGIFYKIRQKLPFECLKSLYYAVVHPHLLYGIEIYANTSKSCLHDLMILNNKLLRIVQFQDIQTRTIDLYKSYNTLPIDCLHDFKILVLMFKFINLRESLPPSFTNYFKLNITVHEYNTRGHKGPHIDTVQTTFGQRCLQYKSGLKWNALPISVKSMPSLNMFISALYTRITAAE